MNRSETAFQIIDFLTASAQNVVHLICESIFTRINPAVEKSKRIVVNNKLWQSFICYVWLFMIRVFLLLQPEEHGSVHPTEWQL